LRALRGKKRERSEVGRRWPKEAVIKRFDGEGEERNSSGG